MRFALRRHCGGTHERHPERPLSRKIITLTNPVAKRHISTAPQGDGAPVETEITSAMIDAGIEALSRLDLSWESSERVVRDVFEAMDAARLYGYHPAA